MKCLRCKTENKISRKHCEKCGAPLRIRRRGDRYKKRKVLLVMVVMFAWIIGFGYFFKDVFLPDSSHLQISKGKRLELEKERLAKRQELTRRLKAAMERQNNKNEAGGAATRIAAAATDKNASATAGQKGQTISTGWVSIVGAWGRQVAKFRSAASAGGWLALPDRACLGGMKWIFYRDYDNARAIAGGLWTSGDMVGLWRMDQKNKLLDSPALTAWNASHVVDWLSLESAKQKQDIQLRSNKTQGNFAICQLPENLDEIGIFVQDSKIVGWTFGQWLDSAFMWKGKSGNELQTNQTVNDFYQQTFAGGREEAFAKGLAMEGKKSSLEKLTTLVEAYQLPTSLAREDTPSYLLPEEIVRQIRILVRLVVKDGNGRLVAKILDPTALREIGDIDLLMDVVPVYTAAAGFDASTSLIADTGRAIVQAGGRDVPALNLMHAKLYQDWLQSLVTVQAVNEAMPIWKTARDYYPDDPYIQLLGVDLYLLNNNWQEAERLLYSRNYPPALRDRFEVLASRISAMKGEEGKIVIRFNPGGNRIPVTALLNGGNNVDFMVDTGASMVTIPSNVADSLGLEVIEGYHGSSQTVSTAGGAVTATQVMIDSLEVDGWVENNVRALVMDIPGQPGMGLLGLNYLQRFKMDLNNDSGTLLLTPK